MKNIFKSAFFISLILLLSGIFASAQSPIFWFPNDSDKLQPVDDSWGLQITPLANCDTIDTDASGVFSCGTDAIGAGGSAIIFDIGDDGGNDSIDLTEIATTGDTNAIFTEPSADKLLIAVGNNWPTADTASTATALAANGANCAAGSAPLGVDASGAVESCFDVWTEAENTAAGYISGNETITLGGDVSGSGTTAITTTIGADKVLESHFKAIDTAADEECLTYESTTGDFEWQPCGGGGDITSVGECTSGDCFTAPGTGNTLWFEGSTADAIETLLTAEDPTSSSKTLTLPQFTGYLTADATKCTDIEGTGLSITTGVLNWSASGIAGHDSFSDFVANEHLDWTASVGTIHTDNYIENATHTGEVTGATALTIADSIAVTNWNLTTPTITTSIDLPAGAINAATEIAADIITYSQIADSDQNDTKCILIETPADADDLLFFRNDRAITVTSIDCICEAATSAVVVINECDSAGDTCGSANSRVEESLTCDVDGATDDGTIGNAGVATGGWLRAQVGTVTGTPGHVSICVTFTYDD